MVLEQARGGLIYALMDTGFMEIYPVNPQSLAKFRKALYPSGAKSDPTDAELLGEMVRQNPGAFERGSLVTSKREVATADRRSAKFRRGYDGADQSAHQCAEDLLSPSVELGRGSERNRLVHFLRSGPHWRLCKRAGLSVFVSFMRSMAGPRATYSMNE